MDCTVPPACASPRGHTGDSDHAPLPDLRGIPVARHGDILLISPPFQSIECPSLGLHTLDGIAKRSGLQADIYYASLHLASWIGEGTYQSITYNPNLDFLGERLFSTYAFPDAEFDGTIFANSAAAYRAYCEREGLSDVTTDFSIVEKEIGDWLLNVSEFIGETDYRVYALSSMFAQNVPCASLVRIIRRVRPHATIIIGGANCDHGMEHGIAKLMPELDHIFVGEADVLFEQFCQGLHDPASTFPKLCYGSPLKDLNTSPAPDYESYFRQFAYFLSDSLLPRTGRLFLPYETSRGCWWGQKNHCTFCGLNGSGMAFRSKDPGKTYDELDALRRRYGNFPVAMADNIMPLNFFDTLLPRLAASDWKMHIFYEQKSNLKREQLVLLKSAGVHSIQPGIEALSTSLLRRMRKGVSGSQNLRLLIDCRSLGIEVVWNLLYGFPGEGTQEYLDTIAIIPLLMHLPPPIKVPKVSFDRFSPYFMHADTYPISNLRPHHNYEKVYPPGLELSEVACHFVGSAPTVDVERPDIIDEMKSLVAAWNDAWCRPELPLLHVTRRPGHKPVLADTRRSGAAVTELLDPDLADAVTSVSHHRSEAVSAGIERGWVVELDGRYVGLATQN